MKATEIHLTDYPQGLPTMQSFRFVETEIIPPKDGEVTIRNSYMSVDPYMRGRMTGIKTYADPYQLNAVMTAGAVGEITASAHPCLLYTSPSPRDRQKSRMPSSA